jgi:heme iron utilization protein
MNRPKVLLRPLLESQTVAALGTLHRGEAYVSMVPFALTDAGELLIHVSALAVHTKDMIEHPRVSLLVMAPDADSPSPQARPRATLFGDAEPLAPDSADYAAAKALYLARFPQSAQVFELPDFTLFRVRPGAVRLVGGFAQAASLVGEPLAAALRTV